MKKKVSFMERLVEVLERRLGPIAAKIEAQRHVQSIKNGMMALISVLMVGSFTLVFSAIAALLPTQTGIPQFFEKNSAIINLPFNFTFGLLALYCAITISYFHAQKLKVPLAHGIIGGVLTTLVLNVKMVDGVMDTSFLDSRGLFIAIIASLLTVEMMSLFIRKKLTLRFAGLPESIAQTFEAIVPLIAVLIIALGIQVAVSSNMDGQIVPEVFTTILAPSLSSIDTVWAVMFICFLEMLFWFIGLNGYAILIGFVLPFMTQYLAANVAAAQAGTALPHVFVPNFWDYFMGATGSGITGALVILAVISKHKELKAIGKASILPAIFTISEPVVFGLPIAFNPYLFIPFVLGTPLIAGFCFMVFKLNLVTRAYIHVGGTPVPIAQYLSTLDWRAVVYFFVIIGLAVIMYYPFFKMYERSLDKNKAIASDKQAELDKLDLDF